MAQQQGAQHLLFPETLALQHLAHLGHLQLPIDGSEPRLNAVEHLPFRAIDGVFEFFAVSNVELEFPDQPGIERVQPSRGSPFSSDLNERHGSDAHSLIIQLAISFVNLAATSVSDAPICTAVISASTSREPSLLVSR